MANVTKIEFSHPFHDDYTANASLMASQVSIIASHVPFLAKKALEKMETLVDRFNYFSPNSELSQLNNGPKECWVNLSKPLFQVLALSKRMELELDGQFRVDFEGMHLNPNGKHGFELNKHSQIRMGADCCINLGGIGKGFIVDQTAEYLIREGAQNFLINAGGDIRAHSIEQPWKVALMNPYNFDEAYGHIEIKSAAVVTSGNYAKNRQVHEEKVSHFFDIKSKRFHSNTLYDSVTVQGPSAATSECIAKCILMGHKPKIPAHTKCLGVYAQDKKIRRIA